METIFSALCGFILTQKANIATGVIASASYEGLKKVLNFSTLKEKINSFFKSDEEVDKYIETLCTNSSVNPKKPLRDIEDSYEELTGKTYDNELYEIIKIWIQENSRQIITVSEMTFTNTKGFNIGSQHAGQDIINVQGDFYKSNKD